MSLSPTPRSTITRQRERARTTQADLHAVLDAGLVCHLGLVRDGAPVVLPTGYGRIDDTVYVHGSTGAGYLRMADGAAVCLTVTHLDGVVYARSAFHHSLNYRCAVVHGSARPVTDPAERLQALEALQVAVQTEKERATLTGVLPLTVPEFSTDESACRCTSLSK